jgi:hypothetical protein
MDSACSPPPYNQDPLPNSDDSAVVVAYGANLAVVAEIPVRLVSMSPLDTPRRTRGGEAPTIPSNQAEPPPVLHALPLLPNGLVEGPPPHSEAADQGTTEQRKAGKGTHGGARRHSRKAVAEQRRRSGGAVRAVSEFFFFFV